MIPSSSCPPWHPDARPIPPEFTSASRSYTTDWDTTAVILMGSALDDVLRFRLMRHLCFKPTKDEFDHIFRFEGPLGTFSSRMELAFLFGMIDDATFEQLNLIRELRNASAHSKYGFSFSDLVLRNVVMRLFAPLGVVPTPDNAADKIKPAFLTECTFLYHTVLTGSRAEGKKIIRASMGTASATPSPGK
jgi:hypothetical protein